MEPRGCNRWHSHECDETVGERIGVRALPQLGVCASSQPGAVPCRLADHLERSHHVVLLVFEDVAVPDVLWVGHGGREHDRSLVR
jgi:hypothetical protein